MQYLGGDVVPHASVDQPREHDWHPPSATNDQSYKFMGLDFDAMNARFPPRRFRPPYDLWTETEAEALIADAFYHPSFSSTNADNGVARTLACEQRGMSRLQVPNWQSSIRQEAFVSDHEQDLDFWNWRPQDQASTQPCQLQSLLGDNMPFTAESSDDLTNNTPQHVSEHVHSAHQISMSTAEYSGHTDISLAKLDKNDETIADFEGDDPCYAKLLYRALKEAPGHSLDLKSIYHWIENNSNKSRGELNTGWRNSVRHNLSMNGAFMRIGHTPYSRETAKTSWRLTDEAIKLGIQSTTRYRKTPKTNKTRKGAPAIKRQQSGAKGGQATRKATRARQARKKLEHEQKSHEQHFAHPPCVARNYLPIHVCNPRGPVFYPSPPEQQLTTTSPFFNMTAPSDQYHETSNHMPMLDIPSQLHLPLALATPQSPQSMPSLAAIGPPLPSATCAKVANGGNYDLIDPYMNELLFGEDSGFSEMGTTPTDDSFAFMNE